MDRTAAYSSALDASPSPSATCPHPVGCPADERVRCLGMALAASTSAERDRVSRALLPAQVLASLQVSLAAIQGRPELAGLPGVRDELADLASGCADALRELREELHGVRAGTVNEPTRVLLVDDQALFRGALGSVLDAQPDFRVVGQAADGLSALDLAQALRPDLVLMDVEMSGMDGVSAARALLQRVPSAKVVMLTVTDDDEHLLDAVRAGVHGYLLKDMAPADLFEQLRAVRRQETPISPALVGRLLDAIRTPARVGVPEQAAEQLSERELQILRLVADGLTNREIGQRLFITEGTAKNHVHNALRKLHLENRSQAAAYIIREGLAAHWSNL